MLHSRTQWLIFPSRLRTFHDVTIVSLVWEMQPGGKEIEVEVADVS